MDNFISLKHIRKIYKMGQEEIVALKDINLDITKNEFVCLFGTSGSGKSTILNMMAGLEKPTSGEIYINKLPIHKMSEAQVTKFRQLNVGFVFQSYNLIPTLNALENVSLSLILQGVPRKKRDKLAEDMLKAVGLGNRLKHKPREMSGGQQQRVSIARAFVARPKIVFADEPTGNLDTKTTFEIMNIITGMARENNQTLILVTHDEEIAGYVNRVIHVRDGAIESIDINKNVISGGLNKNEEA